MKTLKSKLTGMQMDYLTLSDKLENQQFTLGGNWEYDQACFDRALDGDQRTVWLRIPFQIPKADFDPEASKEGSQVIIGTPYVLSHQYQTANDDKAQFNTFGAFVNQFQTPVEPDGRVEHKYIEQANSILQELESHL